MNVSLRLLKHSTVSRIQTTVSRLQTSARLTEGMIRHTFRTSLATCARLADAEDRLQRSRDFCAGAVHL